MSDKGVEVDPRKTEGFKNLPKPLTLFVASWDWLFIIIGSWKGFLSLLSHYSFD